METPRPALRRPGPSDVYTVSRLNREARLLLERGLGFIWVQAEMSNLSRPSSGHWYFSLKDRDAQVRCAMFRQRNLLCQVQRPATACWCWRACGSASTSRAASFSSSSSTSRKRATASCGGSSSCSRRSCPRKACSRRAQASAPRSAPAHRHRDLADRRGAAGHPPHRAPPLSGREPCSSIPFRCRAAPRQGRSRQRLRWPRCAPNATCSSWRAAAARSKTCGPSTTSASRGRLRPAAFRP